MGIVAAQCRVFITQNDICAPRPLYYHLFFLDNRHVSARSPPRRLLDSIPLLSILPAFHAASRLSARLSSRKASRLADVFAICGCFRIAFRASPVPFLRASLSFSRPFSVYPRRLRSRNRGGRGVHYHPTLGVPCHCSSSLRSPSRFPACRAERVACRGVGRGGKRGVLWNVSHETGQFPVNFSMPFWCCSCHYAGIYGVPVRWMDAVPCCRHAMQERSVYVGLRRFPFSVDWLVSCKRRRAAYMGVPPLFSFLGGSGSGTASGRVLGYSGVLCRWRVSERRRVIFRLEAPSGADAM